MMCCLQQQQHNNNEPDEKMLSVFVKHESFVWIQKELVTQIEC